jgi:hypothetical protein
VGGYARLVGCGASEEWLCSQLEALDDGPVVPLGSGLDIEGRVGIIWLSLLVVVLVVLRSDSYSVLVGDRLSGSLTAAFCAREIAGQRSR